MHQRILNAFQAIVGPAGLITAPEQLRTYECDGLTNFRVVPAAVLLPDQRRAGAGRGAQCAIARASPSWRAGRAPG